MSTLGSGGTHLSVQPTVDLPPVTWTGAGAPRSHPSRFSADWDPLGSLDYLPDVGEFR